MSAAPTKACSQDDRLKLLQALAHGEARFHHYQQCTGGALGARLKRLLFYPRAFFAYGLANRGLFTDREILGTTFWGRKMHLRLGDAIGTLPIHFFGVLGDPEDSKLTRYFLKNLRPDDVFYDIGTNWGFYAFLAHDLLTSGEVHAFEPLPDLFAYLKKNSADQLGARLVPNNFALWSESGDLAFFDQSSAGHSGASTAVEETVGAESTRRLTVKASTLDEYVKTHRLPTVLKIDVEGGERHVIQGGREFLAHHNPVVAMEVWSGENGQRFSAEAVRMLCDLGYTPHMIEADGELAVLKPNVVDQIDRTENVVFKKT